jgi:ABC-2 type transport system ATP-binding protein
MSVVIETRELTKAYGKKTALHGLSLTLEEKKIIGLIGRNGAGKTTMLKVMAGYIQPSSGQLTLWGQPVFDNLNVLSQMVFVDEEMQYDSSLRLVDVLQVAAKFYPNWDDTFAKRLVRYFNLDLKKHYKKLSRGMKTQFNIIVGLASRAPLTLLDEPTLGLDAAVRREFYSILLKDYIEHPRTVIISSHLLSEMENLLSEIVLINEGRLILHESVEVLQEYGVYLEGSQQAIADFAKGKEVWSTERFGPTTTIAVRNDFSDHDMAYLRESNIDLRKIPVQDLCIFLTRGRREGGFDEFENEHR